MPLLDVQRPTKQCAPTAPPDPAAGYEGGRLPCIKVLGSWVGDARVCSAKLLKRVKAHLGPLETVPLLGDTRQHRTSLQVRLEINRFCANTSLVYFIRTMPREVTSTPAQVHDSLIIRAFHRIVGTSGGTLGERTRAEAQARLPVRLGGMGLSSMASLIAAARIGTWALCWRPMQQLLPQHFAGVNLATSELPSHRELRTMHADLLTAHRRVAETYAAFDDVYDYDKTGASHPRFYPPGLPPAAKLLPPVEMGSASDELQHAQRTYSQIIHHSAWLQLWARLQAVSTREAVRFVCASQPHAGDWLNAVPKHEHMRMHTWAMRIAVQRRLGLPLLAVAAAPAARSRHGKQFDVYGDVASNDGEAGHQTRHFQLLLAIHKVAKSVWGGSVQREPPDYRDYSDTRPDLAATGAGRGGGLWIGDLKLLGPIGSDGSPPIRGAMVAFGCTLPAAQETTHGLQERGAPSDGRWRARAGVGHVPQQDGQYTRALSLGCTVYTLLFETFGGFSPDVCRLLKELADVRENRLSKAEYDDTTWAARTWQSWAAQQLSVAVQQAVAEEIAHALGIATA